MPKVKIQIRRATLADNVLLAELGRQTFSETFGQDNTPENMAAYLASAFSPEKQAQELTDANTVFLVAESDGLAIGFARLKRGTRGDGVIGEQPIEIGRIYAQRAWTGRGVGASLMEACLLEAQCHNCDVIWLDVWERNLRAIAFYEKWGFVQVGTQLFRLGDDLQNDLIMARRVNMD